MVDKQVKLAVKALIVGQDAKRFLVLRQVVKGVLIWDLPGGKVEYGENPYHTLEREIREETNLEVSEHEPVGMYYFFRVDGLQVAATVFWCVAREKEVNIWQDSGNEMGDEMRVDQYAWVTASEFSKESYAVPHVSLKRLVASVFQESGFTSNFSEEEERFVRSEKKL